MVHGGEGKGRNICFVEEKKSDVGKGGKYLEKEKYYEEKEKEENIWRGTKYLLRRIKNGKERKENI